MRILKSTLCLLIILTFSNNCGSNSATSTDTDGEGVSCIHLTATVGDCLEVGTIVFVTLDENNRTLVLVNIGDVSITLDLTGEQLSGIATVQVTGVSFDGLPHTLDLNLTDGVPTGFSLDEEGGPGECTEETLEAEAQDDVSSCDE